MFRNVHMITRNKKVLCRILFFKAFHDLNAKKGSIYEKEGLGIPKIFCVYKVGAISCMPKNAACLKTINVKVHLVQEPQTVVSSKKCKGKQKMI